MTLIVEVPCRSWAPLPVLSRFLQNYPSWHTRSNLGLEDKGAPGKKITAFFHPEMNQWLSWPCGFPCFSNQSWLWANMMALVQTPEVAQPEADPPPRPPLWPKVYLLAAHTSSAAAPWHPAQKPLASVSFTMHFLPFQFTLVHFLPHQFTPCSFPSPQFHPRSFPAPTCL